MPVAKKIDKLFRVEIRLNGCDDTTKFELEVSDEQFEFLRTIARLSTEASTYGCQPTLRVKRYASSQEDTD